MMDSPHYLFQGIEMGKATMLSKPRSCCCCIDLRTGCIVLAILQILGGGGLVLSLTNLAMQRVSIISFNFVYSVLHFYFVPNSYVDQLKKCLFVPTNMDQVVVPVTPIFEQIPHLPVQETPHPEPFYFVMPQPHSKA
ncbi:hypothetical protein DSO57_1018487 [Entomophthora muscae]|uniref:Uncharacterized protein n=1 Tax=Entomophthora muscae TaxID=34485 RepID=A0ACC2TRV1_9FUNG|nr:hypothetical protein DSO57_1018487 [Entomophthora muscae]